MIEIHELILYCLCELCVYDNVVVGTLPRAAWRVYQVCGESRGCRHRHVQLPPAHQVQRVFSQCKSIVPFRMHRQSFPAVFGRRESNWVLFRVICKLQLVSQSKTLWYIYFGNLAVRTFPTICFLMFRAPPSFQHSSPPHSLPLIWSTDAFFSYFLVKKSNCHVFDYRDTLLQLVL